MGQKDKDFDLQKIKEIIEEINRLMKELGLVEVEIKEGSKKIVLRRAIPVSDSTINPIAPCPTGIKGSDEKLEVIKSPTIGIFYRALKKPDSEPFVEIGSMVTPQTVVCIIDAMKVMNEITAKVSGTIEEILVENKQSVEYGQILFKVKPK